MKNNMQDINDISLNIYKIFNKDINAFSLNKTLKYLSEQYLADKVNITIKTKNNDYKIKYSSDIENNFNNNDIIKLNIKNNFGYTTDDEENNISYIVFNTQDSNYVLSFYNPSESINYKELKIYANIYSDFINNINLINDLMNRAFRCKVTGLYNRNYFDEIIIPYINKLVQKNDQNKTKICVVFGDMFRLKFVNDNFGHEQVDKYIKFISHLLEKYFKDDYVIHQSGDEFLIISLNSPYEDIKSKLDMVQEEAYKIILGNENGREVHSYINFGISYNEFGPINIKEMIKEADIDMSNNKNAYYKRIHFDRRK